MLARAASGLYILSSRSIIRRYGTAVADVPTVVVERARQLEGKWQGISLNGGKAKNFIGGSFVESKTEKWIDIHDPVSC